MAKRENQASEELQQGAVIPHALRERVSLKLLSWFLRAELPKILPECFDRAPKVTPHSEQGWSNHTFIVTHRGRAYVVRMKRVARTESSGQYWADYHKEEWILNNLPGEVPVPKPVRRGIGYVEGADGRHEYAYMVQDFLPFKAPTQPLQRSDRLLLLRDLGRLGSLINCTVADGYGFNFDPILKRFPFKSWGDLLRHEIRTCRISDLVGCGIVTPPMGVQILERLQSLMALQHLPVLFHRDFLLNWGNVLADEQNKVRGIIDWELAGAGPGVHYELASALYVLYRDAREESAAADEFAALLKGYNISPEEFEGCYRVHVESLVLMTAIAKVHRYAALKENGGLKDYAWRQTFARRAEDLVRYLAAGGRITPPLQRVKIAA